MITSNLIYILCYSLAFIVLYYLVANRYKPLLILVGNLVFYVLCDWKYSLLLIILTVITWILSRHLYKKWGICACIVAVLVAILLLFRCMPIAMAGANKLLNSIGLRMDDRLSRLAMPIGLSFYVLKIISYLIDVYKGKYEAEKDIVMYASYVSFFPEILSGPVSRYSDYRRQFNKQEFFSAKNLELGIYLIIKGLFLKLVIANRLAPYCNAVFSNPAGYQSLSLWFCAVFYAIELYCDFAGYSYIAIGITQMLNLHLQENFNRPYLSTSIREFWTRWHISLSEWLKDYVYIPLGGNRNGKIRQWINTIIVFLISGIWHGMGINYLVWGAYNGVLTCISPKEKSTNIVSKVLKVVLTFALAILGWIIFKTRNLSDFAVYIKGMFRFEGGFTGQKFLDSLYPFTGDNTSISHFVLVVLMIIILIAREIYEEKWDVKITTIPKRTWQVFLFVLVVFFGSLGTSSFIYAGF